MAINFLPSVGFTLTIPNTTTLVRVDDIAIGADAIPPPDNCVAIVVYNMSAGDRIFVKFGLEGVVTSVNMTVANSTVIPGGGSMTFDVGFLGQRIALVTGGQVNMYLMAETGANVPANVTFLQGTQRPET